MAFMGCAGGSALLESQLVAMEEAVKENAVQRLTDLLDLCPVDADIIYRKHLLHHATWFGYSNCVRVLLQHGALPDQPHRKNGCTPLHLAHFCQVEDTSPFHTVNLLIDAGARVNNPGSEKCGKLPIHHAIQHQRVDCVKVLIDAGANLNMETVVSAIDVANPQILELLLESGGQCNRQLEGIGFWGRPLRCLLYSPLKFPRECYKQMFRLLVQATVCKNSQRPRGLTKKERRALRERQAINIESELRNCASDYTDMTNYLYTFLIRNGYHPSESLHVFMSNIVDTTWVRHYTSSPASLREICARKLRSHLYNSGNVLYGIAQLKLPQRLQNYIAMYNPY